MSSITYDAPTRELRNVPTFFATVFIRPRDIDWHVEIGDAIAPGTLIGVWLYSFSVGIDRDIIAPDGCAGTVLSIADDVDYNSLNQDPSQVLITVG